MEVVSDAPWGRLKWAEAGWNELGGGFRRPPGQVETGGSGLGGGFRRPLGQVETG